MLCGRIVLNLGGRVAGQPCVRLPRKKKNHVSSVIKDDCDSCFFDKNLIFNSVSSKNIVFLSLDCLDEYHINIKLDNNQI